MKSFLYALPRRLKRYANNSYVLLFCNGFLLSLLALVYLQVNYEEQLFKSLAAHVTESNNKQTLTQDSLVIRSLHVTHELEKSRSILFGKRPINNLNARYVQPLTYDLMTGQQACGGFSYVLGRLLQEMDMDIRFAQMKVNGMYGGHILVETKMNHGWVVLDPMFDLFFTRPDGKMASFADVQGDWPYYSKQVPDGYKPEYNYAAVRYTNWDKIPVVMPAVKNVLYWSVGREATEGYSIRNLFLRKFDVLFYSLLVLYIMLFTITARRYYLSRKKFFSEMQPEILFPKPSVLPVKQVPCNPVSYPINL